MIISDIPKPRKKMFTCDHEMDAWNVVVWVWSHLSRWLGKSSQRLVEVWGELDCPRERQKQRNAVVVGVEASDNPSRDSADPQGNHKELELHQKPKSLYSSDYWNLNCLKRLQYHRCLRKTNEPGQSRLHMDMDDPRLALLVQYSNLAVPRDRDLYHAI